MKFQFKLREGKKGATIILELRFGKNVRIRLATPFNIPSQSVKYWDNKAQLIKPLNDILNADQINFRLNQIRTQAFSELSLLITHDSIDIELIKERLQLIINPVKHVEQPKVEERKSNIVLDHYTWYINFYKDYVSPNSGKTLSLGTLKTYKNAQRYFNDYLTARRLKKFTFNQINKDFYYDFIDYGQDLGYSKNYIGSMIQKLKTIVQSAYDEDIHTNGDFRKRYFKKFREEVNHPYLTSDEIDGLNTLEIKSPYIDSIRDVFIIACHTGLRIGDLSRFLKNPKMELFNGRKHIQIKQRKTGKAVIIPLKKVVLDILEKRNGNFPPYIHKNLINKEIKPLLKQCGITEIYTVEKTVGGKQVLISKPKYQHINCHTARRSFCTNAYNSGVPIQDIMVFSGHSSEKMLMLCIKASAKEKASRVMEHPYFN